MHSLTRHVRPVRDVDARARIAGARRADAGANASRRARVGPRDERGHGRDQRRRPRHASGTRADVGPDARQVTGKKFGRCAGLSVRYNTAPTANAHATIVTKTTKGFSLATVPCRALITNTSRGRRSDTGSRPSDRNAPPYGTPHVPQPIAAYPWKTMVSPGTPGEKGANRSSPCAVLPNCGNLGLCCTLRDSSIFSTPGPSGSAWRTAASRSSPR